MGLVSTPIEGADCLYPQYESLYGPVLPDTAWGRKGVDGRIDYMDVTPLPDKKFSDEWLGKIKEVVDNYHPDLIWLPLWGHELIYIALRDDVLGQITHRCQFFTLKPFGGGVY